MAVAFAAMAAAPAHAAMIAEWKLDEGTGTTVADTSGSPVQHDGTISGATWQVSDNPHGGGGFGSYLHFDGNDYVTISANGSSEMGFGAQDFTIEFWFRIAAADMNRNHEMLGVRSGLTGWSVVYAGGGGFGVSAGAWSFSMFGKLDMEIAGLTVQPDTWQHFALVHDQAAGTYTAYLTPANGTTQSVVVNNTTTPAPTPAVDGRLASGGSGFADLVGDLDFVRLHDTALSASELGLNAVAVPEPGILALLGPAWVAATLVSGGRRRRS